MREDIEISVLFPVFKPQKDFFHQSLNSILNQTFRNIEVLLLYEPSADDGFGDCMKNIKDSRLKVITLPPESGLPRALNCGIECAKGKYLARMDSDDEADLHRFAVQHEYMEKHSEIDVLGCAVQIMGTKKILMNYSFDNEEHRLARMLFYNAGVAHPSAIIKKSFIEENKIKYNEELRGSEDYHLWIDILLAGGKMEVLSTPYLYYRMHNGQASNILKNDIIRWDGLAKEKILNCIGTFTEKEKHLWNDWSFLNKYSDLEAFNCLFRKIINENKNTQFLPTKILKREMMFQWIINALSFAKKNKSLKMFKIKYLKNVFCVRYLGYTIKSIISKDYIIV